MSWFFQDETTPATQTLLTTLGEASCIVPAWWYIEVTNIFVVAEQKGRTSPAQVANFISMLATMQIELDNEAPSQAFNRILPLCRSYRLTSYDAVYLELAQRRQLPLATLDESLRQAAAKLGLILLGK
jgi:predicted nucleic acid-binding protein